ncbi:MAG: hypothetical protein WCH11_05720 [Bdellovibrio sp.]
MSSYEKAGSLGRGAQPPFPVGKVAQDWAHKRKISCHFFSSLPSTSRWVMEQDFSIFSELSLVLTNEQTQGRGRTPERSWESGAGAQNLTMNWVFPLGENPARPPLPARMGLALYLAAVESFPRLTWSLKAPNDLWLNQKKVAGLLLEAVQRGRQNWLSLGLGLNVFFSPPHVPSTHLRQWTEVTPELFESFLEILLRHWQRALSTTEKNLPGLLSPLERESLLQALKKSTPHQDLLEVSPQADLKFPNQIQSWQDL